jgi:hypothetical protein
MPQKKIRDRCQRGSSRSLCLFLHDATARLLGVRTHHSSRGNDKHLAGNLSGLNPSVKSTLPRSVWRGVLESSRYRSDPDRYDGAMLDLFKQRRKKNEVLRLVVIIEADNGCSVALQSPDETNSLARGTPLQRDRVHHRPLQRESTDRPGPWSWTSRDSRRSVRRCPPSRQLSGDRRLRFALLNRPPAKPLMFIPGPFRKQTRNITQQSRNTTATVAKRPFRTFPSPKSSCLTQAGRKT